MTTVTQDTRKPLASIGLVCLCGNPIASIEGAAHTCFCGRIWIITATLIGPA